MTSTGSIEQAARVVGLTPTYALPEPCASKRQEPTPDQK
jgi:hypothetical protein